MYFKRLAVNTAFAPARDKSSSGNETSPPNSSSLYKKKEKKNINELVKNKWMVVKDGGVSTDSVYFP